MRSIRRYSGYVIIAFVVVCALSFFWFIKFNSPSSKESFESDEKKMFTIKYSEDAPGKKGDEFYINKNKKLIHSSTGDIVHNQLKFDRKGNEIIGQLRFETMEISSSSIEDKPSSDQTNKK